MDIEGVLVVYIVDGGETLRGRGGMKEVNVPSKVCRTADCPQVAEDFTCLRQRDFYVLSVCKIADVE